MKKKILCLVAVASAALTACYDDDDLWEQVDELSDAVATLTDEVKTLQSLVQAQNSGKKITNIEETADGFTLTFDDGTAVSVKNGKDGQNGTDGKDGQDGQNGKDGVDGADGQDGKDGDSLFSSFEIDGNTAIITLADGSKFTFQCANIRVLTFEDEDYLGSEEGSSYWTSLIDDSEYGGSLLYGDYSSVNYYWYDENNTDIFHNFTAPYWSGGHAISNYSLDDYNGVGFNNQLSVYFTGVGGAGCKGSKNFAVHLGYIDDKWSYEGQALPEIEFVNEPHVINHMYVNNICYTLNSLINGDSFAAPASDGTWFKILATGYNEAGLQTGTAEFYLCDYRDADNKVLVEEWTKWDLTSLGKVQKVTFNIVGSSDLSGEYGLNTPAYFAYDNVAVEF